MLFRSTALVLGDALARQDQAAKRKFDLNPVDGESVQKMVAEIYNAPQELKDRARKLLTDK